MWQFSGKIRSKPARWEKVNDPTIVTANWHEEIVEHDRVLVDKLWGGEDRFKPGDGEKKWPREPITNVQIDYILAELEYAASQPDQDTEIFVCPYTMPVFRRIETLIPKIGYRHQEGSRVPLSDICRDKGRSGQRGRYP